MNIKYRDNNQPRQLFLDTVVDFYEKLGDKKFWADIRQADIALEALTQDYMRTDHTGYKEEDGITLQTAISEYRLRCKYMSRLEEG